MGDAKIIGLSEFRAAVDGMVLRASAANKAAVTAAGHAVEAAIKGEFTLSHVKGTPTPSQPGQPPAVVSGNLRRSVHLYDIRPAGVTAWGAKVAPSMIYSRAQELGNPAHGLPARPYVRPGELSVHDRLLPIFRDAWGSAIAFSGK